jgi:hypothetical protein
VTCLPRLEPPLFSVPFALAAFRFRSAQCLVHETPLTPPVPPRVAGFFMGTRYGLSGYRPGKAHNARVWRCSTDHSKHKVSTGRNVAANSRNFVDCPWWTAYYLQLHSTGINTLMSC